MTINWIVNHGMFPENGDEGKYEWWTVTDGARKFECDSEADAVWLADVLTERNLYRKDDEP